MKQLSYWANGHRRPTRLLIIGCYAIANLAGGFWGFLLYAEHIKPSPLLLLSAILVGIAALIWHPAKGRTKAPGYTYAWHKSCDVVICLASVYLLVCCATEALKPSSSPTYASIWHKGHEERAEQQGAKAEAQGIRHFLDSAKRWYSELNNLEKVLLVTLIILLTVAFCIGWAALCCGLMCNGMEFLAIFLGIVGIGGAIVGCVFLCRHALNGASRRIRRY